MSSVETGAAAEPRPEGGSTLVTTTSQVVHSLSPGAVALSSPAPTIHEALSRPAGGGGGTWLHARQAQESAIITAVRRQMEALDEKLSGHIAREITRVQQQGDQLREAAVQRLDAKIASVEGSQPKLDRRLAELNGICKGLSEEMQSQIRRIDLTDSRLYEWRQHMDEEMRGKLTEIEQNYQQVCTTVRVAKATTDDVLKRYTVRLVRLEELLEERTAHAEDLSQSVTDLHGRLLSMEDPSSRSQIMGLDHVRLDAGKEASSSALAVLERQSVDFLSKIELLSQEICELRSCTELQEERYKSLRTLYETKEEQYRSLTSRVDRENWEGRLKDLQGRLHDHEQTRMTHAEQLEILQQKLELHDQGLRQAQAMAAGRAQAGLQIVTVNGGSSHMAVSHEGLSPGSVGLDETVVVPGALAGVERRLAALGEELEVVRADLELAPRVGALVAALKDVAPKVIAQEASVGDLSARVARVEELAGEVRQLTTLVQPLVMQAAGAAAETPAEAAADPAAEAAAQ